MRTSLRKNLWQFVFLLPVGICLVFLGILAWHYIRPQPAPTTAALFRGVGYIRDVRTSPRPMVIHIIQVDLQADGIRLLVTPGDPDRELPLSARRTSDFLSEFELQIAINGDQFSPYRSNSILDFYPHSGDGVDVSGYAVSEGTPYSNERPDSPTLFFSKNNNARFNQPFNQTHNAISGIEMLVLNGRPLVEGGTPEPRSAVGINRGGRLLTLVVVDGRQPGYSEGATLKELADILIDYNCHDAMNLDGGGSSTLAAESLRGGTRLLNNPIDSRIPGRERVVGNHLGIYADPE